MWPTQLSTYPHSHHNEMRYISPFGHYACSGMESKWFMLWLQGCPQWLLEMAREGPRAANITPSPPCPAEVPAAVAKFTPPSPSIPAHHVGILLLSCTPAYRESCESARKPPRLAVPFLSLYSGELLPFISNQLPNHSVALPLSLLLFLLSFSHPPLCG